MKRQKKIDQRPAAPTSPKGGFRQSHRAPIPEEALSFREQKVLRALRASGSPMTVRELARRCFPGMRSKPKTYEAKRADGTAVRQGMGRAYRCVLNSLRRLVVGSFVEKTGPGTYMATGQTLPPT